MSRFVPNSPAFRIARSGIIARPVLSLVVVLGLAVMTATWVSIPLYAQGAAASLLDERVDERSQDQPPFSYLFAWSSLSTGPIPVSETSALDAYLMDGEADLGLPVVSRTRHLQSTTFTAIAAPEDRAEVLDSGLRGSIPVAEMSGFFEQVDIVDGRVATADSDVLEAVVSRSYAQSFDVSVGDVLTLVDERLALDDPARETPVLISGVWQEGAPSAESWLIRPSALQTAFFVPEGTIAERSLSISSAQWFVVLERGNVGINDVDRIIESAKQVTATANEQLPGTRRAIGPVTALENFRNTSDRLEGSLRQHATPFLAITAWFVLMVGTIAAASRRTESAILRSRGASARLLLASRSVEAIVLATVAGLLGIALALPIAGAMSRTRSFLDLGGGTGLAPISVLALLVPLLTAVAIGALLQIAAALPTIDESIVDRARSRARELEPPWWRRRGLDMVAIALLALLARQALRQDRPGTTLLDDPLVVLLPASCGVAAGLVLARVLPLAAGWIARQLGKTDSVAGLLAMRQISRSNRMLTGPLVLLATTVTLATFSASLGQTMDFQTLDEAQHRSGADASFVELPPRPDAPRVPITDYKSVRGVRAATPVITEDITVRLSRSRSDARFLGVDAATFGSVAYWRSDYAEESLGELMGRLDATPEAVLITADFAAANALGVSSVIEIRSGDGATPVVVAGVVDQFPTHIASDDRTLIVGNSHYFNAVTGTDPRPRIFVDLEDTEAGSFNELDPNTRADLRRIGTIPNRWTLAADLAERRLAEPGRQAIFGLLTTGFVLAAMLTVASFCAYAIVSFRRRSVEVGIVRALGLGERALLKLVGLDLAVLAFSGAAVGVAVGIATSSAFIPTFAAGRTPVLLVEVGGMAIAGIVITVMVAVAAVIVVAYQVLKRQEAFESIKLGETL